MVAATTIRCGHHTPQRTIINPLVGMLIVLPLLLVLPATAAAGSATLDDWLQDEALPYLANRLGRHPRLKGQRVQVIAVKNNRVSAEMDGLTAYIRQRIIDYLHADPDVNLAQPLPDSPRQRHPADSYEICTDSGRAQTQVTLEVSRQNVAGGVRVSLRAIDLVENTWVPGFQKAWTGEPTALQRQQLKQHVIDTSLKGTRELPYKAGEPDLLAAHLARNVGCRLALTGHGNATLQRVTEATDESAFFRNTTVLLGRYLTEFTRLKVSTDDHPEQASMALRMLQVDGDLYQVWVAINWYDPQVFITGLDTPAYVRLDAATLENARLATRQFIEPVLIASFQLIAPRDQAHCRLANPWAGGFRVVGRGAHLPSGGCFAIQYQAAIPGALYLFAQTEHGALTRLMPTSCNALNIAETEPGQGDLISAPRFRNGTAGYFQLDNHPGNEWIYAVAVTDAAIETRLAAQLSSSADLCGKTAPASPGVDTIRQRLNNLQQATPGKLEWRAMHFVHDPPRAASN